MGGEVMGKSIIEIVGEIIAGQACQRTLSGEEIETLIKHTYRAFREIEELENRERALEEIDKSIGIQPSASDVHQSEAEKSPIEPKIDPRNAIQDQEIFCIECGRPFKVISHTHLRQAHGLSPAEYKEKWGIPAKQPLAAKNVTQRRRDQARERNVGEELRQYRIKARSKRSQQTPTDEKEASE
jgi:predicted transcriptional regulator